MAKSKALTAIVKEAKHLKRKYPHRFDHLKKSTRWSRGYIKQASAIYASKHHGKSPVGKKRKKKRAVGAKKATPVKRKKPSKGRRLVKQVTKRSVERVVAGKRPGRRRHNRKVRMAGAPRRRSVGKTGGSGLLIGLAIGAAALYFLTKGSGSTPTATYGNLPPLTQTNNYTRDTQSQQIVNYALAAGLTINAITSLINSLNSSSDNTVNNVYDKVNTTGSLENTGLPGFDPIA